MTAYATSAELADFSSYPLPSDPGRQLQRASELLDAIVVASFSVDADTDQPVDTDVAAALRDACCAQVEFWSEVGEANDVDGLAGTQASVGSYSGTRAPEVAPRALRILRNANLMVNA